jgi:hypothetical protein
MATKLTKDTRAPLTKDTLATRIEALVQMFDACEAARRTDGGIGLELQDDGLRVLADEAGIPYVAVHLLYGNGPTIDEWHEWEKWNGRDLGAAARGPGGTGDGAQGVRRVCH